MKLACYEAARNHLLAFLVRDGKLHLGAFLQATSEMERCITSAVRAIDLARVIRGYRAAPDLPKKLRILADDAYKPLNNTRNHIEHLNEEIKKKKLSRGDPVCLMLKDDSIQLFDEKIAYEDLAKSITELHGLAQLLSQHKVVSGPEPVADSPERQ